MSYRRKVLRMARKRRAAGELKPGTVNHIQVAHDSWCAIFQGGECNCNATVTAHDEWPPTPIFPGRITQEVP